jgi:hypothetical protein
MKLYIEIWTFFAFSIITLVWFLTILLSLIVVLKFSVAVCKAKHVGLFEFLNFPFPWLEIFWIVVPINYGLDNCSWQCRELNFVFVILLGFKVVQRRHVFLIDSVINDSCDLLALALDNSRVDGIFDMSSLVIFEYSLIIIICALDELSNHFLVHQTSIGEDISKLLSFHAWGFIFRTKNEWIKLCLISISIWLVEVIFCKNLYIKNHLLKKCYISIYNK